jgi:hypothetical protein
VAATLPPDCKSDDRGGMSSQEAVDVSLMEVMPTSGKGTLGTWWCHLAAWWSDTEPT